MGLVVTIAAPTTHLVTEAAVKAELGITTGADDALLQRLIRRVSSQIVDACGQALARETVRETLPGTDTERLMLARTPIVSVTTVTIDGRTVTDYTIEDAAAGFLARENGWPRSGYAITSLANDSVAGTARGTIVVTYVAGYVLEAFSTGTPTLPGVLEAAAMAMVRESYLGRAQDPTITSERLGDWSQTYSPTTRQQMLDAIAPYRRVC